MPSGALPRGRRRQPGDGPYRLAAAVTVAVLVPLAGALVGVLIWLAIR